MSMDVETAKSFLEDSDGKPLSKIGEAIDVLYKEYGSYKTITQQLNKSNLFLRTRHRIYLLPPGIRWKVDVGEISIQQSYEISRLENEEDQWILALVIVETENFSVAECKNVVKYVLKSEENKSLKNALGISAGIHLDKIQSLMLPLNFENRLAISKHAWTQCLDWKDLCLQLLRQVPETDRVADILGIVKEEVESLENMINSLSCQLSKFKETLSTLCEDDNRSQENL